MGYSGGGLDLADSGGVPLKIAKTTDGLTDILFQVDASGNLTLVLDGSRITVDAAWIFGGFDTFTDQDATPDVSAARNFKTANTAATTITMFDGGTAGQEIVVVIGDALTTIDFTGTNLKGNGGADWSPASGDHLRATFDGTDWYCECFDNTA
jgi:hypothetical protein